MTQLAQKIEKTLQQENTQKHLDYGCGDGYLTKYLARKLPNTKITGYDINKKEIGNKLKTENIPNAEKLTTSLEKIPDQNYDSATINCVLHHNLNDQILQNTHQKLKQDGQLIITDYNIKPENFKEKFNTQKEKQEIRQLGFNKAKEIHTKYTPQDYIQKAEQNGFKTQNLEENIEDKFFIYTAKK